MSPSSMVLIANSISYQLIPNVRTSFIHFYYEIIRNHFPDIAEDVSHLLKCGTDEEEMDDSASSASLSKAILAMLVNILTSVSKEIAGAASTAQLSSHMECFYVTFSMIDLLMDVESVAWYRNDESKGQLNELIDGTNNCFAQIKKRLKMDIEANKVFTKYLTLTSSFSLVTYLTLHLLMLSCYVGHDDYGSDRSTKRNRNGCKQQGIDKERNRHSHK